MHWGKSGKVVEKRCRTVGGNLHASAYCSLLVGVRGFDGSDGTSWVKLFLGQALRAPAFSSSSSDMRLQAIDRRCLQCGYRLAWVLWQGRTSALRIATSRRSSQ